MVPSVNLFKFSRIANMMRIEQAYEKQIYFVHFITQHFMYVAMNYVPKLFLNVCLRFDSHNCSFSVENFMFTLTLVTF